MKTLLAVVLSSIFAAVPSYAAQSGVSIRLAEVSGAVSARASSSAAWTTVKNATMLAPGGEVKTADGASVVLAFSDGNKVKLASATTFGVEGATTLKTSLRLFAGRLSAWVKRANKADFTVRHAAGVAAVRGTVFAMEGSAAGLKIELFEGALDIVDSFGRPSSLSPGQNAQLTPQAGLQGISSLPPDAKAPEEPKVEAPPAPTTAAVALPAQDAAPQDVPSDAPAALPPPNATQEGASAVSPSAP